MSIFVFSWYRVQTLRNSRAGDGSDLSGWWSWFDKHRAFTIAALVWVAGVFWRFSYILRTHHARHHVASDAVQLTDLAKRLVDAPLSQTIGDTIWPPGASATLALFMARDATLSGAAALQFALSCAIPVLFAHAAYLVAGGRVAVFTLLATSLDFGLVHYGGFFLSEQFFQFGVALAVWCTMVALCAEQALGSGTTQKGTPARRLALGAVAGAAWALATVFRPNALPIALILGLVVLVYWCQRRRSQSLYVVLGAALSFLILMTPVADRCSRLSGKFCPVSNNFAMNAALGQLDGDWGIEFADPSHPELTTGWVPPIMIEHGYRGMITVPYSIYDTQGLMRWVWRRFAAAPGPFLARGARNVLDLFRFELWPRDFAPLTETGVNAWVNAFGLVVLAPGLIGMYKALRTVEREPAKRLGQVACATVVLSVLAIAAFSMGEARYRIPFDGLLIIFAGIGLMGQSEPASVSVLSHPRILSGATALGGSFALIWFALIIGASVPQWGLANKIRSSSAPSILAESDVLRAATFERPPAPHGLWNAATNYIFQCAPTCRQLRLQFERTQLGRRLELSTDSNDAYRVTFFQGSLNLGFRDVTHESGPGERVDVIKVPRDALGGFDSVGVLPLYGDGDYSLGSLRVLR